MNFLFHISDYFIDGYLIAFLLNASLFKIIHYDFMKMQDFIGRLFLIGLIMFACGYLYEIVDAWYYGVDYEQYIFINMGPKYFIWFLIEPFVLIILNVFERIRKHPFTAILNSSLFFGRLIEFYIIVMTSSVTFSNLNSVYKTPLIRMTILGILFFVLGLIWIKKDRRFI